MTTQTTEIKCKDRVAARLKSRMTAIRKLWAAYRAGEEDGDPEYGTFNEYGLSFDYVAPGTYQGQRRGYFRYQLSWGGPADEFRFFVDELKKPTRIEYWFMDWWDGAKIILKGRDRALMTEILGDFDEMGMLEGEMKKALTDS